VIATCAPWRAAARVAGTLGLGLAAVAPAAPPAQGPKQVPALAAFDFRKNAAQQTQLPHALHEASGLTTTADGRVFTHGDERGVVSQVDACRGTIVKTFSLGKPAVRGDFEGIAVAGTRFFLVTSTGWLYETTEGANNAVVPFRAVDTGFGKTCEIEGLAYEPTDRVLLLGCKRRIRTPSRGGVTLFRWSLDRSAPAVPPEVSIPLEAAFHVSSVEREPRSGHYVLVAGPERLLAEVTARGEVVATRMLHRALHPQPEGITFVGDSLLVVVDEGRTGPAVLTCYHRVRY
jgi:uncharacterized protein YjiK